MKRLTFGIGTKFGKLTIIEQPTTDGAFGIVKCRCDCGNEQYFKLTNLKNGRVISCGCARREVIQKNSVYHKINIGDRFGKLLVIRNIEKIDNKPKVLCRCDCGEEKYVLVYSLLEGAIKSCSITCARKGVPQSDFQWTQEKIKLLGKKSNEYLARLWKIGTRRITEKITELGIKTYKENFVYRRIKTIDGVNYYECSECGEFLPEKAFSKNNRMLNNIHSYCRECSKLSREEIRLGQWNKDTIGKMYELFGYKCAWCDSTDNIETEHYIPNKLGGTKSSGNCYPCCAKCNRGVGGKFDKNALDWAVSKFGKSYAIKRNKEILRKLQFLKLWKKNYNIEMGYDLDE